MFALVLGTAGVGIVSQIMNLNSFIMMFGLIGLPLGLVKYISKFEAENDWNSIYSAIKTVVVILGSLGLLIFLFTLIFPIQISKALLDSDKYYFLILLLGLSVPFSFMTSVFDAFLRGIKRYNEYTIVSVIISLIGLIFAVPFVLVFKIEGVLYSIVIGSIISLCVYIYYFKRKKLLSFRKIIFTKFNSILLKKLINIGVGSLIIGVISQGTLIFIRSLIIRSFGIESNGIYQTVYAISNNYFGIFFVTIATYTIPVLSEKNDREHLFNEINNLFKMTIWLLFPLLVIFFVFRNQIINLFYSPKFLEAGDLFFFNLLGDYFKALAWIFGVWLIPYLRIKAWVLFDVVLNINFFLIFIIIKELFHLKIESVTIAYLLSNIIHFLINYIFFSRKNKFIPERRSIKIFFANTAILIILFVVSKSEIIYGYFLFVPFLIIWALFVFNKKEYSFAIEKVKIFLKIT